MSSNKLFIILTLVGTYVGNYVGYLISDSYFSFTSVFMSAVGGVMGIWIGWKLFR